MKYVVDRIEENLVVLVNSETREIVIKKYEELPRVVPGDTVYYDDKYNEYYVDKYERAQRLRKLRINLRNIMEEEN